LQLNKEPFFDSAAKPPHQKMGSYFLLRSPYLLFATLIV